METKIMKVKHDMMIIHEDIRQISYTFVSLIPRTTVTCTQGYIPAICITHVVRAILERLPLEYAVTSQSFSG